MEFIWIYSTTLLDDTQVNYFMEEDFDYYDSYEYLLDKSLEKS